VEYIKHVGRYVSSFRNAAYEARGSADNALEAAQTHSRETNVECGAVIKPRFDKGVDKSSSSSGSERARDPGALYFLRIFNDRSTCTCIFTLSLDPLFIAVGEF